MVNIIGIIMQLHKNLSKIQLSEPCYGRFLRGYNINTADKILSTH